MNMEAVLSECGWMKKEVQEQLGLAAVKYWFAGKTDLENSMYLREGTLRLKFIHVVPDVRKYIWELEE